MTRLRTLGPTVKPTSTAIAKVPPKVKDSYYYTDEWKTLRILCLRRDKFTCQAPGCGNRATVADHIVSRKAGGADVLSNLRALCRSCDARFREDHMGKRRGGG